MALEPLVPVTRHLELVRTARAHADSLGTFIAEDSFSPPSPHSVSARRELLNDAEIVSRLSSLERTEDEIAELIESLRSTRRALRTQRVAFQRKLVLVHLLPAEVLRRIVLMGYYGLDNVFWRRYYGWWMCDVCRSWKAVALGLREIWTTMLFESSASTINFMTQRAGPSRLFHVAHSTSQYSRSKDEISNSPEFWLRQRASCPPERWGSLNVLLRPGEMPSKIFCLVAPRLVHLESFTIEVEHPRMSGATLFEPEQVLWRTALRLTLGLPTLQTLHLVSLAPISFMRMIPATIVNLRLSCNPADIDLLDILSRCRSMGCLWLSPTSDLLANSDHGSDDGGDDGEPDQSNLLADIPVPAANSIDPVLLLAPPTLHTLVLDELTGLASAPRIIEDLRASSLRQLAFFIEDDDWTFATTNLQALFHFFNRLPKLESLSIQAPIKVLDAFAKGLAMGFSGSYMLEDGKSSNEVTPVAPGSYANTSFLPYLHTLEMSDKHSKTSLWTALRPDIGAILEAMVARMPKLPLEAKRGVSKPLMLLHLSRLTDAELEDLEIYSWDVRHKLGFAPWLEAGMWA